MWAYFYAILLLAASTFSELFGIIWRIHIAINRLYRHLAKLRRQWPGAALLLSAKDLGSFFWLYGFFDSNAVGIG